MQREEATTKNYLLKQQLSHKNLVWRSMIRMSVGDEERFTKVLIKELRERFYQVALVIREKGIQAGIDWSMRELFDDTTSLHNHYKVVSYKYARYTIRHTLSQSEAKMYLAAIQEKVFGPTWESALQEYLQLHGVRYLSEINETTRKKIISILNEGIQKNMTLNEIAQRLMSPMMHRQRAMRIARTETTRAMNAGILVAAATLPYKVKKQWITSEDERVRGNPFSHVALHGTTLPLEVAFNNGEHIRFPGDPNASPENVINCRCVLNIVPTLDKYRRPIPRQVTAFDADILNQVLNLV